MKIEDIELVVLDVDGTIVHYDNGDFGSSWDALAYALDVFEETQTLFKRYYMQRDKHDEWLRKQLALFKGKYVETAQKYLYPLPYSRGIKEFSKKSDGKIERGILSSSLDIVAKKIEEELNLDFCLCNILGRDNTMFNGEIDYRVPLWDKHLVLKKFCEERRTALRNVAYVGDHENDIPCFESVGLPIAFNPKKQEVRKKTKYIISDFKELNRILDLK